MSDESDESLIPAVRQKAGYRSLIAGHQKYSTVTQALNSPVFWDSVNRKLGKGWKEIRRFIEQLLSV